MKRLLVSLIILLLAGCSSNAPPLKNLLSKTLNPPTDAALVYIIRPYKWFGGARKPDFEFNNVTIGAIENNRYLYFYAYPMVMILVKYVDGNIEPLKIKLEAGRAYFLKFDMREGYSQLSQDEGMQYLRKLNMSANFKPIVIGTAPSKFPQNIYNQSALPSDKSEDYLKYDDHTKTGIVRHSSNIGQRNAVLLKIEEVCNTKNIALLAGETKQNASSYRTLDETIENKVIEIKFQCLY